MRIKNTPGCPTPHKYGYDNRAEAKRKMRMEQLRFRHSLDVYLCECGQFHLGNRTADTRAGEAHNAAVARDTRARAHA